LRSIKKFILFSFSSFFITSSDASAMPLHWIYDTNEIANLVGSGSPFFFNPPSCPFYQYSPGWSTPYGQQTLTTLQVCATGVCDPVAYQNAYYALYKTGGPADRQGYYFDASTKEFVANVEAGDNWPNCGGNDNQADALAHIIPVIALLGGNTTEMLATCDTVIRVTQNTDEAVAFGLAGARVLSHILIDKMDGKSAVTAAIADMRDPNRAQPYSQDAKLANDMEDAISQSNLDMDYVTYVLGVGQSCDYPFQISAGSNLIARNLPYKNATALAIFAGGDSGSRNFYVGAANAAILGNVTALPSDWMTAATCYSQVSTLAAQLVSKRAAL
jgi:ADP-ribosylglycohydrolase